MSQPITLSRDEKLELRSVHERSIQRAEQRQRRGDHLADAEIAMLKAAVRDLDDELAGW